MEWDHFDYSRIKEMRNNFVPLDTVKAFVGLKDGQSMIDVGAGDGFYSLSFASDNPKSAITALEPGHNGLLLIKKQISELGIKNVNVVEEDACQVHDYSHYDKVFFSSVFHDLGCKEEVLKNMSSTLKKGSEVVFIEFRKEVEAGPPQHIRISEDELRSMLEKYGFKLAASEKLRLHYMHKYING